jgi:hypothetical protein
MSMSKIICVAYKKRGIYSERNKSKPKWLAFDVDLFYQISANMAD